MLDLGPAARRMTTLLEGVTDDQLTAPTPCENYRLGDLVDHIDGLTRAFTAAATKDHAETGDQQPTADARRLAPDWRTRIPTQLAALAEAWRAPQAWQGTTRAGGIDLPGEVAGLVALDELVLHGWDVARATGQPYDIDTPSLEGCMEFVSAMSTPDQLDSREGLFGPIVPVPPDRPLLDRVLGLSGRDPAWTA
ncbi:TIGR03086 family metal-binding protein [Saccharopolyspora taberi]|uniref:TIGR03086 family metal-binding protein n=1 Tax=Saccharopolyspora taberi TaxID=60895 RepID=A0ABN3VEP9_9PSEU